MRQWPAIDELPLTCDNDVEVADGNMSIPTAADILGSSPTTNYMGDAPLVPVIPTSECGVYADVIFDVITSFMILQFHIPDKRRPLFLSQSLLWRQK